MRRPAAAARPGRGAIRVPVAAQRRATLEKALRARANARKKRVDRLSRARAREGATRDDDERESRDERRARRDARAMRRLTDEWRRSQAGESPRARA